MGTLSKLALIGFGLFLLYALLAMAAAAPGGIVLVIAIIVVTLIGAFR